MHQVNRAFLWKLDEIINFRRLLFAFVSPTKIADDNIRTVHKPMETLSQSTSRLNS